jgi:tRNA G18 (ribose-2'-O)-methylase SpoU/cold shock CspA family protein
MSLRLVLVYIACFVVRGAAVDAFTLVSQFGVVAKWACSNFGQGIRLPHIAAQRPQRSRISGPWTMTEDRGGKKKTYRKGSGELRSRWDARGVSSSADQPQGKRENPVEVGDEGEARIAKLQALADRRFAGLVVVLEDIGDTYNCGAALRSCEAFGVTEVWLVQNGIKDGTSMRPHIERQEPFDVDTRKMKESSASASRWVTTRSLFSSADAARRLEEEGYAQVAVVASRPLPDQAGDNEAEDMEGEKREQAEEQAAERGGAEALDGRRIQGIVESFNHRTGFGFIRRLDASASPPAEGEESADVFVHKDNILMDTTLFERGKDRVGTREGSGGSEDVLREGERVEFRLGKGAKGGPVALHVRRCTPPSQASPPTPPPKALGATSSGGVWRASGEDGGAARGVVAQGAEALEVAVAQIHDTSQVSPKYMRASEVPVAQIHESAQAITKAHLAQNKLALWFGNELHGLSPLARRAVRQVPLPLPANLSLTRPLPYLTIFSLCIPSPESSSAGDMTLGTTCSLPPSLSPPPLSFSVSLYSLSPPPPGLRR